MKYIFTLLILFTLNSKGQNILKFDKINVQCEDKWITYPMDKDSTYTYGFIYIDYQAGLTLNYEGEFKIDAKGKFIKIANDVKKSEGFIKIRLQPNLVTIAEIPESKFQELNIEKVPDWLKSYKLDENSIDRLFRWGYMYNGWNETEKALTYLEKAEKIDSNFKGLQTELAFSYNALKKFDKAEIALIKAIENNPNDCYSLKELAYTYNHLLQLDKSTETYDKMVSVCSKKNLLQETAYNLAYQYYLTKDKQKFEKWYIETRKWSEVENQYTKNLDQMKVELN